VILIHCVGGRLSSALTLVSMSTIHISLIQTWTQFKKKLEDAVLLRIPEIVHCRQKCACVFEGLGVSWGERVAVTAACHH